MPTSTDTILKDVKSHADGDATLSAALGAIYIDEDPPNSTLPYWKFSQLELSSSVEEAFGTGYLQNYEIQIDIYHTSFATLKSLQDTLHARFDRASISMTSGDCIRCQRTSNDAHKTLGMFDKNGSPVYMAVSTYWITVNKSF